MKAASPTLLPLLRSRSQGDILAAIVLEPDRERSLTELAEEVGTSVPTVTREVDRLEAAGIVVSTIGRFCIDPVSEKGLVLGVSAVDPRSIRKGVEVLAGVLEAQAQSRR